MRTRTRETIGEPALPQLRDSAPPTATAKAHPKQTDNSVFTGRDFSDFRFAPESDPSHRAALGGMHFGSVTHPLKRGAEESEKI
jgi:hypothetical protein